MDRKFFKKSRPVPLLRWAGSKRQLIPELRRFWPGGATRYIEPFAGSACLFFELGPKRALLGDVNRELIETYREVKHRPIPIAELLEPLKRSKRTYYRLRKTDPTFLSSAEKAARFIYLNRFCFNGLYRTNRAGAFNVPYGAAGTGELATQDQLLRCSWRLKSARLCCCDFEKLCAQAVPGDFVYLDPPFRVSERRVFSEYQPEVFSKRDLERLRESIERLAAENVRFLVSYVDSAEAEYLQTGFYVRRVQVRRNIAGFVDKRTNSQELLISNFVP
jgi:DNA adenine methylase